MPMRESEFCLLEKRLLIIIFQQFMGRLKLGTGKLIDLLVACTIERNRIDKTKIKYISKD
jgi:hypothetical protein